MKQNFRIVAPLSTHWQAATCAEVDCPHYLAGWLTIVPEGSEQAEYIRYKSGRTFTEERNADGTVGFSFKAGQRCFRSHDHRRRIDKPELFLHESQGQKRVHARPEHWVEHIHEEIDPLIDLIERERGATIG